MRIAMTLLALSLTVSVTACKKKKTEDPNTGSGSGSSMDMGSGSSMAGSDMGSDMGSGGSDTGSAAAVETMQKKAGNCPSTVAGSTTTAELKGKDVVLTIVSEDKDAVATIQRRTEELLKDKASAGSGEGHDQKGTHGGSQGICPVYLGEGGKATSKPDAKGVVITITTDKGDDLKKAIDERITKAADWVKANVKDGDAGTSGGVGGGSGDHGGNHSGQGDGKGKERDGSGGGSGAGTGGGGGSGTGKGDGTGDKKGG